jgi:hypothetical protein
MSGMAGVSCFACLLTSLVCQIEFCVGQPESSVDKLRLGDITYQARDLRVQREVLAKPGDRIVLVGGDKASGPKVLHAHTVVDGSGSFRIPWLHNATVRAVSYDELIKKVSQNGHTLEERALFAKLRRTLDQAAAASVSKAKGPVYMYIRRINTLLKRTVSGYCMDNPILGTSLERKLRGILAVLAADWRRIGFVIKHMLNLCYWQTVEMCYCDNIYQDDDRGFDIRFHVWQNFGQVFQQEDGPALLPPGAHSHIDSVLASTQLTGTSRH